MLVMDKKGFNELLESEHSKQYEVLSCLTDQKLKSLSKTVNRVRCEKYRTNYNEPKYGNLRRVFYQDELLHFFDEIRSPSVKYAFLTQFFFALRIGEIRFLEYEPRRSVLKVYNQKKDRYEYMPLHSGTKKLILALDEFQNLSSAYLRKAFRSVCDDIGLDYIYMEDAKGNNRYQFTTHCLRKTAITLFAENIGQELKVKEFARHKKDVTSKYFHYHERSFKKDLENAFRPYKGLLSGL